MIRLLHVLFAIFFYSSTAFAASSLENQLNQALTHSSSSELQALHRNKLTTVYGGEDITTNLMSQFKAKPLVG